MYTIGLLRELSQGESRTFGWPDLETSCA